MIDMRIDITRKTSDAFEGMHSNSRSNKTPTKECKSPHEEENTPKKEKSSRRTKRSSQRNSPELIVIQK